jgi:DNA helicase-2/ATP-dependent DNA helicase PcrA
VLIDSAQRKRLARRLAREHGVFDDVIAEGMEVLVSAGLKHIAAFQHAGKRPRDCEEFARSWARRLETNEDALPEAELEASKHEHARFVRFVRLYSIFAAECLKSGQLTFEDLILLPCGLINESPAAQAMCRADYKHAVVDEFQDVNTGQIDLLRALWPDSVKSPPDLCVVGDDDQSIYLFRGADDRAFDKFARYWAGAKTIPLTENYRSEQPILEVAATVIAGRRPGSRPTRRSSRAARPGPPAQARCGGRGR